MVTTTTGDNKKPQAANSFESAFDSFMRLADEIQENVLTVWQGTQDSPKRHSSVAPQPELSGWVKDIQEESDPKPEIARAPAPPKRMQLPSSSLPPSSLRAEAPPSQSSARPVQAPLVQAPLIHRSLQAPLVSRSVPEPAVQLEQPQPSSHLLQPPSSLLPPPSSLLPP
eukprot:CAMPEP_0181300816 /NCGR_PEP_ID=MMETSP1101-20121128/7090_1 /TAXON_ID=46948 /ORGANISM="Rhodomonas abbreviata, Strain Caron Lab Isolate" /LENGTH=168 /DNA_ID=CAMNT_0023406075 /DNA_START=227 /DNA_END=730 /DNA_ORIENTATION=-